MHVTSKISRFILFATMLAGFVSAPPVHAQNLAVLTHVRVPFAFRSGSQVYPAGTYTVRIIADDLLYIEGKSVSGLVMVRSHDYSGQRADHTKLIFTRYGNRYFLEEIWTADTDVHIDCGNTADESQLRKEIAFTSFAKRSAKVELAALRAPK